MKYDFLVMDSLKWLAKQKDQSLSNVVTGIPDMDELSKIASTPKYEKFFTKVANLIFEKTNDHGYCIFIQTDRKFGKEWIDKSYLITDAAYKNGYRLLWHKIILDRPVGATNLFRPTYSHILCYSVKGKVGEATPDVLDKGKKLYKNGTDVNAATLAIKFIKRYYRKKNESDYKIIDPFVGRGTISCVAKKYGLSSLGIDIDKKQIQFAKNLLKI